MSKGRGQALTVMPKKPVRRDYGRAPWSVNDPAAITEDTKVTICHSPAHFGPAARFRLAPAEQLENRLPPLQFGKDQ